MSMLEAVAKRMIRNRVWRLTLTKDYVSSWGVTDAVREILQNALDFSADGDLNYSWTKEFSGWTLHVRSPGAKLNPQTLLLGYTTKADDNTQIGQFGEGYKIALLVLTRLDKEVHIHNQDKLWSPRFEYSADFGTDLLVIEENEDELQDDVLSFTVVGLTDEEKAAVIDSSLQMQGDLGGRTPTEYGTIITDEHQAGKIYVKGLFVTNSDMKYGYNIKPEHIELDRDRSTVSNWELKWCTTKMWVGTKDYDKVAEMIEAEVPDVGSIDYDCPDLVKEALWRLFKAKFPNKLIARTKEEMERKVKEGMTEYVYYGSAGNLASSSSSYRSHIDREYQKRPPTEAPHVILSRFFTDNRKYMNTPCIVAFKGLIEESKNWIKKREV